MILTMNLKQPDGNEEEKKYTIGYFRQRDINKELDKIKRVEDLKKKLLHHDNNILVLSKSIILSLSDKD